MSLSVSTIDIYLCMHYCKGVIFTGAKGKNVIVLENKYLALISRGQFCKFFGSAGFKVCSYKKWTLNEKGDF